MPASAVNGRARSRGRRTSELLRFATAGSVDDGKSTLIGRLLYDARSILADQLAAVRAASQRRNGNGALDLALLTDGLRAEREQGITIDVAYRYFQTPRRKFIIADTPGHIQYTRNMVTGASSGVWARTNRRWRDSVAAISGSTKSTPRACGPPSRPRWPGRRRGSRRAR